MTQKSLNALALTLLKLTSLTNMAYPRHLPQQEFWYHGTGIDQARSIVADGKLRQGMGVYFANTLEGALNFGLGRAQGTVAVFCVPTHTIKDLELSLDHDPEQYPEGLVCAVTDSSVKIHHSMLKTFKFAPVSDV